jgi:hypothetical protein
LIIFTIKIFFFFKNEKRDILFFVEQSHFEQFTPTHTLNQAKFMLVVFSFVNLRMDKERTFLSICGNNSYNILVIMLLTDAKKTLEINVIKISQFKSF